LDNRKNIWQAARTLVFLIFLVLLCACGDVDSNIVASTATKIPESTLGQPVVSQVSTTIQPHPPAASPNFVAVGCQKTDQCNVVSSNGFVFNTRDGHTWNYLATPVPVKKDQELNLIDCPDPQICYVVGIENSGRVPRYAIFFTTNDGGKSWKEFKLTDQSLGNFAFEQMTCPSLTTCYAVSPDGFVLTKDGGKNWQRLSLQMGGYYKGISCTTGKKCILVSGVVGPEESKGSIYTTEDGWDSSQNRTLNSQQPLSSVSCLTDLNCIILGSSDLALTTSDGGKSWGNLNLPKTVFLGLLLSCYSSQKCYTIFYTASNSPEEYTIYNTPDNGKNWSFQKASLEKMVITSLSCTPSGLCIGTDRNGYPKIASNIDGGKWSLQAVNWK